MTLVLAEYVAVFITFVLIGFVLNIGLVLSIAYEGRHDVHKHWEYDSSFRQTIAYLTENRWDTQFILGAPIAFGAIGVAVNLVLDIIKSLV